MQAIILYVESRSSGTVYNWWRKISSVPICWYLTRTTPENATSFGLRLQTYIASTSDLRKRKISSSGPNFSDWLRRSIFQWTVWRNPYFWWMLIKNLLLEHLMIKVSDIRFTRRFDVILTSFSREIKINYNTWI